jgi:hypothetical protein
VIVKRSALLRKQIHDGTAPLVWRASEQMLAYGVHCWIDGTEGHPRSYLKLVCLLIVNHSFAEAGPGSAVQLAGYWEVFSPGPLTPPVTV